MYNNLIVSHVNKPRYVNISHINTTVLPKKIFTVNKINF